MEPERKGNGDCVFLGFWKANAPGLLPEAFIKEAGCKVTCTGDRRSPMRSYDYKLPSTV